MPRIILVHSFKGGTGKTLFSTNLAKLLSKDKRVLLIESDFAMPAFTNTIPGNNPDIYFNDFLATSENDLSKYIYPDTDAQLGVVYCDSEFRVSDKVHGNDQNWFKRKKAQINDALSLANYDYVVFDTQPGLHMFIVNIIALAEDIVLMLRPDRQSINGTKFLLERVYNRAIRLMKNTKVNLHLVFNQVPKVDEMTSLLDQWKTEFNVNFDFLRSVNNMYYQETTSYHTAIGQFILPDGDPTLGEIQAFIDAHL